jgi:hypothetical protein
MSTLNFLLGFPKKNLLHCRYFKPDHLYNKKGQPPAYSNCMLQNFTETTHSTAEVMQDSKTSSTRQKALTRNQHDIHQLKQKAAI